MFKGLYVIFEVCKFNENYSITFIVDIQPERIDNF